MCIRDRPIALLNFLESLDAFRRPERLEKFLLVCEANVRCRTGCEDREYPQRDYLNGVLAATRDLNFASLLAEKGKGNAAEAVKNKRLQLVTDKVAELRASND